MDLFEEALRRWEEALTFRDKQTDDEENCAAVKTGAGDAIAEHSMEVNAEVEMQWRHRIKKCWPKWSFFLSLAFKNLLTGAVVFF